nr:MAG TPA_asm: hypothetical protein [Caudoviricetes sp.]
MIAQRSGSSGSLGFLLLSMWLTSLWVAPFPCYTGARKEV